MRAEERRQAIRELLQRAKQPVSATALAAQFSVSRQIIVGDIALLRAAGADISATPRGYVILRETGGLVRQVAVQHDAAGMGDGAKRHGGPGLHGAGRHCGAPHLRPADRAPAALQPL